MAAEAGAQGQSWLTAAIHVDSTAATPMENSCCSCKLTRLRAQDQARPRRARHDAGAGGGRGRCRAGGGGGGGGGAPAPGGAAAAGRRARGHAGGGIGGNIVTILNRAGASRICTRHTHTRSFFFIAHSDSSDGSATAAARGYRSVSEKATSNQSHREGARIDTASMERSAAAGSQGQDMYTSKRLQASDRARVGNRKRPSGRL